MEDECRTTARRGSRKSGPADSTTAYRGGRQLCGLLRTLNFGVLVNSECLFVAGSVQSEIQVGRRKPVVLGDWGRSRLLRSKCNHDRRQMAGCASSRTAASRQRNSRIHIMPEWRCQRGPNDRLRSNRRRSPVVSNGPAADQHLARALALAARAGEAPRAAAAACLGSSVAPIIKPNELGEAHGL